MFHCRKCIPDLRHSRVPVTDINVKASFKIRVLFSCPWQWPKCVCLRLHEQIYRLAWVYQVRYEHLFHRLIHTYIYAVYFLFFSLEVTAWRKMKKPEPTTRVGLAPDMAWGVGAIQRDRGGPWDRKQYSSLPDSTPDNTALATRKRHPLGWVSDQKIARQICWKEYFRQTTVEFQRHISNNTCPLCVTVDKTHL